MYEEFPAAHSMDTTWFAVDEEGHVGFFDTGENGAAPDGASTVYWPDGMTTALDALPTDEHGFRLAPGPGIEGGAGLSAEVVWRAVREQGQRDTLHGPRIWGLVLLLADEGPLSGLSAASLGIGGDLRVRFEGALPLIYLSSAPAPLVERLLSRGQVLGGALAAPYGIDGLDLGVFGFHPPHYGRTPDYRRVVHPARPLHVDALPEAMAELAGAVRLPGVRFSQTRQLRLSDHLDAWGYGGEEYPLGWSEEEEW